MISITDSTLSYLNVPRFPGSEGEKRIVKYLTDYLLTESYSFSHHLFSTFGYESIAASLKTGQTLIQARPYLQLKNTDSQFVEGSFFYIPRLGDIDTGAYKNAIVLIDEPLTYPCLKRLEAAGVSAVITHSRFCAHMNEQSVLSLSKRSENIESDKITGIDIDSNEARKLVISETRSVAIMNSYIKKSLPGHNLISELPGTEENEIVIICAHHDSLYTSPGAVDNLSGTLILLKIHSALRNRSLRRSVRFCWFGSEELNAQGSYQYALQMESNQTGKKKKYVFAFNIDSADVALGCDNLFFCENSRDAVFRLNIPERGIRLHNQEYGGDNLTFEEIGIPTVTFTKTGFLCDALQHQMWDTVDNAGIHDESLNRQARNIITILSPLILPEDL